MKKAALNEGRKARLTVTLDAHTAELLEMVRAEAVTRGEKFDASKVAAKGLLRALQRKWNDWFTVYGGGGDEASEVRAVVRERPDGTLEIDFGFLRDEEHDLVGAMIAPDVVKPGEPYRGVPFGTLRALVGKGIVRIHVKR